MELMTALVPQAELSASYRLCGCSADLLLQQHTCEIMPSGMHGDHGAVLAWPDPFPALESLVAWRRKQDVCAESYSRHKVNRTN